MSHMAEVNDGEFVSKTDLFDSIRRMRFVWSCLVHLAQVAPVANQPVGVQ